MLKKRKSIVIDGKLYYYSQVVMLPTNQKATKQFFDEELSEEPLKEEAKSAVGDDKVRILSTGFDLKTNFRH